MSKHDDKVEGLVVLPKAMQQDHKSSEPWIVAHFNHNRLEYRWDEDSRSFVIEFPRILSCGPTLEDALKALCSAVTFQAYCLRTGNIPTDEQWKELNEPVEEPRP